MKLKPDIALVDFVTAAGLEACDNLKIPVVVNAPFPLEAARMLNFMPDSKF